MKTSIPSAAQSSQPAEQSSRVHSPVLHSGHLSQLATMMNQSPQVQAQLKLSDEIQNGESVQRQMALASGINQSPTAQPLLAEEEAPAQREATPNRSHEACHIVQQKQGRVRPTMQMKGVRVNDDAGPEREADVMRTNRVQEGEVHTSGGAPEPIQAKFTCFGMEFTEDNLDEIPNKAKTLIKAGVTLKALEALAKSGTDFEEITTKQAADAALARLQEEEAEGKEEKQLHPAKAKKLEQYKGLLDHLAGEVAEEKRLIGGHLLSAMKEKFPNLKISGAPDQNGLWEGWWTDGKNPPKWSSFFPASWTREKLEAELAESGERRGGRELKPSGIVLTLMNKTFFPWVNQTLKKQPRIKDMVDPP